MEDSSRALLSLLNDVLDLSRIEAGKLAVRHELLDVVEVCDRAIQAVSPLATRKGLTLTVDIHERLNRHRMGDALRLTQVLINLLANACKFTDHGRVSLKVRPMDHDEVVFEVDDTGMGCSGSLTTWCA